MDEEVGIACYKHCYVEGLRFERQAWKDMYVRERFIGGREHGPRHDRDVWILWNKMIIDAK